jgi:hypothetical protein
VAVQKYGKQNSSASDKNCTLFSNNKDSNRRRNIVPLNRVIGNQLVQKRNELAKQLLLTKRPLIFFIFMAKQAVLVVNVFCFLHTRMSDYRIPILT